MTALDLTRLIDQLPRPEKYQLLQTLIAQLAGEEGVPLLPDPTVLALTAGQARRHTDELVHLLCADPHALATDPSHTGSNQKASSQIDVAAVRG
jgi:hypothetical protein